MIHTTPTHPNHLTATVTWPNGQVTRYGPMRSRIYSLLHARAVRLSHRRCSLSVASQLKRAADLGKIERTVIERGKRLKRQAELLEDAGNLAGWAESLKEPS